MRTALLCMSCLFSYSQNRTDRDPRTSVCQSQPLYPLDLLVASAAPACALGCTESPRIRRPMLRIRSNEDCLPIFSVAPPLDAPELQLATGEGGGAGPAFAASGRSLRQVGRLRRRDGDAAGAAPSSSSPPRGCALLGVAAGLTTGGCGATGGSACCGGGAISSSSASSTSESPVQ